MKKIRSTVLAIMLALTLGIGAVGVVSTQGCKTKSVATTPGKVRDEKLISVTLASSNIQIGIHEGIAVKRALLAEKKISQAQSNVMTEQLEKLTQLNLQLNAKSLEFDTFTAGRADLLKLVDAISRAEDELEASGTIKLSARVSNVLVPIKTAIALLKGLF